MLHTLCFFSSKCRLFHNATLLVHVLFTFYIQGVLKSKCKNSGAKRLRHDFLNHANTVTIPVCPNRPRLLKDHCFLDGSLTSPVCPYDSSNISMQTCRLILTGHNRSAGRKISVPRTWNRTPGLLSNRPATNRLNTLYINGQSRVISRYQRFGTTYRPHLQGSRI
jgi:hypothetical protein